MPARCRDSRRRRRARALDDRSGTATPDITQPGEDLRPLLDLLVEHTPPPTYTPTHPLQLLVTNLSANDYVGRIGIGRIVRGSLTAKEKVALLKRDGSTQERIQHAVERHAEGYEATWNTILSTHAQHWRYEILRKNYARYQRGLRKDLDDWLPELKSLPRHQREAVDAIASFELWHRLREHQGLSKKQSIEIVVGLLQAIIPAD